MGLLLPLMRYFSVLCKWISGKIKNHLCSFAWSHFPHDIFSNFRLNVNWLRHLWLFCGNLFCWWWERAIRAFSTIQNISISHPPIAFPENNLFMQSPNFDFSYRDNEISCSFVFIVIFTSCLVIWSELCPPLLISWDLAYWAKRCPFKSHT